MTKMDKALKSRQDALRVAYLTLKQLPADRARLDAREAEAVAVLRSERVPWRDIAPLLGLSHEGARRKYRHLFRED